jgi:hypothetical protein
MTTVTVIGWEPGLKKISLTKLLQATSGKDLEQAKGMVDALLDGKPFEIAFADDAAAKTFADQARILGVKLVLCLSSKGH